MKQIIIIVSLTFSILSQGMMKNEVFIDPLNFSTNAVIQQISEAWITEYSVVQKFPEEVKRLINESAKTVYMCRTELVNICTQLAQGCISPALISKDFVEANRCADVYIECLVDATETCDESV